MSPRLEFSAKTKEQALARAKDVCEKCRKAHLGKYHFDHILPSALGGKPALANCQVLCWACHKAKSGLEDLPRIRKADRQRRLHIGATAPKQKIESRGFTKVDRPAKPSLAPRKLYRDIPL